MPSLSGLSTADSAAAEEEEEETAAGWRSPGTKETGPNRRRGTSALNSESNSCANHAGLIVPCPTSL